MSEKGNNHLQLDNFCIYPKHHNKGYGTKAMQLMEELYPEVKKWNLGTPHYNVRNQHLYEKMGYRKIGTSDNNFIYQYEKLKD